MAETKSKPAESLRTPKPKKKLGLSVPPALRFPHEDLIPSSSQEPEDKLTMDSMTSQSSQSSHARPSSTTSHTPDPTPISPIRDFTKVPNSINREAVPAGFFTGKSKQLYDCLYSLSRGAVVPSRMVRISRPKLMKRAGIGARVTFDANVERLVAVGLIQVRRIAGEHDGNEYTVFLPEEISMPSMGSLTSQTSSSSYAQNPVLLDGLDSSQTRHTLSVENKDTSIASKTFLKTNTERDDDEALAAFTSALKKATKDVTGRELSPAEAGRWAELADVLITELKIAAGRTTVSSVPAFLAEHLRRRLWKKEKRQIEAEAAERKEGDSPKLDISKCPDCFGTGMWYPQGYEKGVARCPHDKLQAPELTTGE